eukprot:m.261672 g.261672  ORF g.261672 m.261672 type:complete len:2411 (+) comp26784_c0_seq7:205-7437(+)
MRAHLLLLAFSIATAFDTCENGVDTFVAGFSICCQADCGVCGGTGCGLRWHACCTSAIQRRCTHPLEILCRTIDCDRVSVSWNQFEPQTFFYINMALTPASASPVFEGGTPPRFLTYVSDEWTLNTKAPKEPNNQILARGVGSRDSPASVTHWNVSQTHDPTFVVRCSPILYNVTITSGPLLEDATVHSHLLEIYGKSGACGPSVQLPKFGVSETQSILVPCATNAGEFSHVVFRAAGTDGLSIMWFQITSEDVLILQHTEEFSIRTTGSIEFIMFPEGLMVTIASINLLDGSGTKDSHTLQAQTDNGPCGAPVSMTGGFKDGQIRVFWLPCLPEDGELVSLTLAAVGDDGLGVASVEAEQSPMGSILNWRGQFWLNMNQDSVMTIARPGVSLRVLCGQLVEGAGTRGGHTLQLFDDQNNACSSPRDMAVFVPGETKEFFFFQCKGNISKIVFQQGSSDGLFIQRVQIYQDGVLLLSKIVDSWLDDFDGVQAKVNSFKTIPISLTAPVEPYTEFKIVLAAGSSSSAGVSEGSAPLVQLYGPSGPCSQPRSIGSYKILQSKAFYMQCTRRQGPLSKLVLSRDSLTDAFQLGQLTIFKNNSIIYDHIVRQFLSTKSFKRLEIPLEPGVVLILTSIGDSLSNHTAQAFAEGGACGAPVFIQNFFSEDRKSIFLPCSPSLHSFVSVTLRATSGVDLFIKTLEVRDSQTGDELLMENPNKFLGLFDPGSFASLSFIKKDTVFVSITAKSNRTPGLTSNFTIELFAGKFEGEDVIEQTCGSHKVLPEFDHGNQSTKSVVFVCPPDTDLSRLLLQAENATYSLLITRIELHQGAEWLLDKTFNVSLGTSSLDVVFFQVPLYQLAGQDTNLATVRFFADNAAEVTIPDSFYANSFTASIWASFPSADELPTRNTALLSNFKAHSDASFALHMNGVVDGAGSVFFALRDATGVVIRVDSLSSYRGWHQIVAFRDNTNRLAALYIDGKLQDQKSIVGLASVGSGQNTLIGGGNDDRFFPSLMVRDITFWTAAFNPNQIDAFCLASSTRDLLLRLPMTANSFRGTEAFPVTYLRPPMFWILGTKVGCDALQELHAPDITFASCRACTAPAECVFPFWYDFQYRHTCLIWGGQEPRCSLDENYSGRSLFCTCQPLLDFNVVFNLASSFWDIHSLALVNQQDFLHVATDTKRFSLPLVVVVELQTAGLLTVAFGADPNFIVSYFVTLDTSVRGTVISRRNDATSARETLISKTTPNILCAYNKLIYWFAFDGKTVSVGSGQEIYTNTFMNFTDPDPLCGVGFIGLFSPQASASRAAIPKSNPGIALGDEKPTPGWNLVFRQTMLFHYSKDLLTLSDASCGNFARLEQLENYRSVAGELRFKMVWPRLCPRSFCVDDKNYNEWAQTSNPMTSPAGTKAEGYRPIDLPYPGPRSSATGFSGLERSNRKESLLDGISGNHRFFFALGVTSARSIPGPMNAASFYVNVDQVELYVFNPTNVNECADSNLNNCNQQATCIDTKLGFLCQCKTGWVGNGVDCTDVNECLAGVDNCHPEATCDNTPGSFSCSCFLGYSGDGVSCVALPSDTGNFLANISATPQSADEFLAVPSIPNPLATQPLAIKVGIRASSSFDPSTDNVVLVLADSPVNSEDISSLNRYEVYLGANSRIERIEGRQQRRRNTGDGQPLPQALSSQESLFSLIFDQGTLSVATDFSHTDKILSLTDSDEMENVQYLGVAGLATFRFYDLEIVDVDECKLGTSSCLSTAQCVNLPGSHKCECSDGLVLVDAIRCVDVDECTSQTDECDVNADCTNTFGSYFCTCREFFVGDGKTCTALSDCDTSTFGPNERGCGAGLCVDIIPNDQSFTCDCSNINLTDANCLESSQLHTQPSSDGSVTLALAISVPLVVLVGLVFLLLLYLRRRSRPHDFTPLGGNAPKEIRRSNLMMLETLGAGQFGEVFKGLLRDGDKGNAEFLVAIKSLRKAPGQAEQDDFLLEGWMMNRFNHPNLLNLIGVVTKGEPLLLVVEFAEHKSLLDFLQKYTSESKPLDKEICVIFAHHIAKGMAYLASQGCVHRDLAARNCLLDSRFRAKVADFGRSKQKHTGKEYYSICSREVVPARWTAVECLEPSDDNMRRYSSASDVWAYAITCYEIWTGGKLPYCFWSNQEMLENVRRGYRLPPPASCPAKFFDLIITPAWHKDPSERITFDEILEVLEQHFDYVLEQDDVLSVGLNESKSPPVSEEQRTAPTLVNGPLFLPEESDHTYEYEDLAPVENQRKEPSMNCGQNNPGYITLMSDNKSTQRRSNGSLRRPLNSYVKTPSFEDTLRSLVAEHKQETARRQSSLESNSSIRPLLSPQKRTWGSHSSTSSFALNPNNSQQRPLPNDPYQNHQFRLIHGHRPEVLDLDQASDLQPPKILRKQNAVSEINV